MIDDDMGAYKFGLKNFPDSFVISEAPLKLTSNNIAPPIVPSVTIKDDTKDDTEA